MDNMKVDRSTEVKKALEKVVASSSTEDTGALVESILRTLDKQKVFRYHNESVISLVSTPGRVLIALMEDPTMTQRSLSVYLDLSETMIDKTIKQLIQNQLITKTKTQRQNKIM